MRTMAYGGPSRRRKESGNGLVVGGVGNNERDPLPMTLKGKRTALRGSAFSSLRPALAAPPEFSGQATEKSGPKS
jgi:hypothetical protein